MVRSNFPTQVFTFCLGLMVLGLSGCKVEEEKPVIQIDGSSTVAPISKAVSETILKEKKIKSKVAVSGTGGGFSRFSKGETDISDASRPIKDKEKKACEENGVEYLEFQVAIDGLSVVVNPENDWCNCMTIAQLKKLWDVDSKVKTWKDIDDSWPAEEIKLYGPDADSGTFDYFIEEVIGKVKEGEKPCRQDYQDSVIDTELVKGVKNNKGALAYFGYAYFVDNKDGLKAVGISEKEDGSECVLPNEDTIMTGKYTPLSRPLFIYVNKDSLKRQSVVDYVKFYLSDAGQELVKKVSYIQITDEMKKANNDKLNKALEELK